MTSSRPASIAAHREVQSVDPDTLDDDELAGHLTRCHEHHATMIAQHMRFTAAAMIPTGDFLAHVGGWTGLPSVGPARAAARRGAGFSRGLRRARPARRSDRSRTTGHVGCSRSPTKTPAVTLDSLRALDGDAGAAVNGYLDLVGWRLLDGFDISGALCARAARTCCSGPSRIAVEGRDAGTSNVEGLIAGVREKVPSRAPGRVRRAARRGAPDLPRSATSAASSATSGHPG